MQRHDDALVVVALITTLDMFVASSSSSSSSFAKRGAFVDDAELYDVILLKNSCTTLRARMRIIIVMKLLQLCAYVRAIN